MSSKKDPIASYDDPPAPGTILHDNGFTYTVVKAKRHVNRDGTPTCLITWRGICAESGKPFEFKTGGRVWNLRRRSPEYNMGWTKAVPFGTPRPPSIAGEASELAFCSALGDAFEAWCMARGSASPDMAKAYRNAANTFSDYLAERFGDPDDVLS